MKRWAKDQNTYLAHANRRLETGGSVQKSVHLSPQTPRSQAPGGDEAKSFWANPQGSSAAGGGGLGFVVESPNEAKQDTSQIHKSSRPLMAHHDPMRKLSGWSDSGANEMTSAITKGLHWENLRWTHKLRFFNMWNIINTVALLCNIIASTLNLSGRVYHNPTDDTQKLVSDLTALCVPATHFIMPYTVSGLRLCAPMDHDAALP